jgi:hypothetical protein
MRGGEEILLEDLEDIYRQETKNITGIEGVLTLSEAHGLTSAILDISENQREIPPWWESTVQNLRRSLPPGWIVAAGANVYRYVGPIAILSLMTVLYGALGGKQVQYVTLVVVGLAVVSCCYLPPNVFHWRTVVKARRQLVELHAISHPPQAPPRTLHR